MQQLHLLSKRNKIWGIDEAEYAQEAYEREKKICLYDRLRSEGSSAKTALEALSISKSTLYEWKKRYREYGLAGLENQSKRPHTVRSRKWSRSLENDVLALRRVYPLYGKHKLHAILKRTNPTLPSASTIGRIISWLIKKEKIKPADFYISGKRKKRRVFDGHAKRLPTGMKANKIGELVQFDHMTVNTSTGRTIKHFQATCPISKMVVEQAYTHATSNIAAKFLNFARGQFPFKIQSIQIDGGGEFRGEFEQTCDDFSIPLYVLPPRSPELNGVTERANGSARYEFYELYSGPLNLVAIRSGLKRYVHKYNTFRPHQALHYKTPMEYYQNIGGQKSNMY